MGNSTPNAYLRTKVMTASPEELRLMLFDGAIKFAEQGRRGIEEKNPEQTFNGLTRAQDIVMELINTLKPEYDPELCEKLSALYTFIYSRLVSACTQRSITFVDEALNLLRYERETWALLLQKLASENGDARGLSQTPSAPGGAPHGSNTDGQVSGSGLVGGRVSITG